MKRKWFLGGLIFIIGSGAILYKEGNFLVQQYLKAYNEDNKPSVAHGSVGNGTLENGKLMPYQGANYTYFDVYSYVNDRAFLHQKTRSTVLEAYKTLETKAPNRHYRIMECSKRGGGKISMHRTHQNGLSVDFMTPLIKDGKPYYGLDNLGVGHYLLEFDDQGRLDSDTSVHIDFEAMAQHILALQDAGAKHGIYVSKVILKIELKDEFYKTKSGREVKRRNIYVVKGLTPKVNQMHDDHYHIDFAQK